MDRSARSLRCAVVHVGGRAAQRVGLAHKKAVGPDLSSDPAHRIVRLGHISLRVVKEGCHPAERIGLLRDLVECGVVLIGKRRPVGVSHLGQLTVARPVLIRILRHPAQLVGVNRRLAGEVVLVGLGATIRRLDRCGLAQRIERIGGHPAERVGPCRDVLVGRKRGTGLQSIDRRWNQTHRVPGSVTGRREGTLRVVGVAGGLRAQRVAEHLTR